MKRHSKWLRWNWGTRMKNILVALSVGVMMSRGASAQKAPDFSGTWVMDASRSDAAIQTPPVGAAKVVIRQSPEEIQIDTTTTKDGFSTEKYKMVAGNPPGAAPSRSAPTFRWEGTKLITVQEMEINGFAVTVTEARSLDPTGAEMTVRTELVVQHGYSGTVVVNGIDASSNASRMKNVFVRSR